MDEPTAIGECEIPREEYYHDLAREIVQLCWDLGWDPREVYVRPYYGGYTPEYRLGLRCLVNKREVYAYGPYLHGYSRYSDEEAPIARALCTTIIEHIQEQT